MRAVRSLLAPRDHRVGLVASRLAHRIAVSPDRHYVFRRVRPTPGHPIPACPPLEWETRHFAGWSSNLTSRSTRCPVVACLPCIRYAHTAARATPARVNSGVRPHMKQTAFATFQLTITALGGIVCLASDPDYYILAPISLAIGIWAVIKMKNSASRKIFLVSFSALTAFGFILGRNFFEDHRFTEHGISLIMLFGAFPAVIVSFVVYFLESSKAQSSA